MVRVLRSKNPNYGSGEEPGEVRPPEIVEEEDPPTEGEEDNDEEEENSDEGEENSDGGDEDESESDQEEELEPMRPLRMYFPPTEYNKKMKISTRCYLHDMFETFRLLDPPLTEREKRWFETHPQFKHIFHMPRDKNHKLQGMWLLLLRTACTEKRKEVWFVVNGVPIRYGLREHGLISGLYCHNYPLGYDKKSGAMSFVQKYFTVGSIIRYQDLKPMIVEMGQMDPPPNSDDRLRMLILYFLASIMKAHTKTGPTSPSVDPLLLRAVSDLNFCKTFPWGRFSYDYMLEGISNTMSHFNGVVPESEKQNQPWPIPGFVLPLELLAFEAIPQLNATFREPYPGAHEDCPKMCKSKFKRSDTKGIPFERINAELGTTKDIDNFITADASEKRLLLRIMEKENDVDKHCVVVESWMKLAREGKVTFLKDMFDEDVARLADAPQNAANPEVATDEPPMNANTPFSALVDLVESMKKEMEERMTRIENKVDVVVDQFEQRIAPLEAYVNEQTTYMRTYEENIFHDKSQGSKEKKGDGMNGEKEGEKEGDGIIGEDNREKEREPIVTEKGLGTNVEGNVSKEGGKGGESVGIEEEPVKEKEASTVVLPDPPKRVRFKQLSRKRTPEERQRDAINLKLKEGKRQKLEEATRQKLEEATRPTRMSTRLRVEMADKEKKVKP